MVFGNKKSKEKLSEQPAPLALPDTPDLVVDNPQNVGMMGFTEEAPLPPVPEPPAPQPAPVVAPVVAPVAPAPAPVHKYKVMSAEALQDGTFAHVIVSTKMLGEVGMTYDVE